MTGDIHLETSIWDEGEGDTPVSGDIHLETSIWDKGEGDTPVTGDIHLETSIWDEGEGDTPVTGDVHLGTLIWDGLNKERYISSNETQKQLACSGGSRIFLWGRQLPKLPTPKKSTFCRKQHENERIWIRGGGRASLAPPLDPPMV